MNMPQQLLIAEIVAKMDVLRVITESATTFMARANSVGRIFDQAGALTDEALWNRPRRHQQWCLHLLDHPELIVDPDARQRLIGVLKSVRKNVTTVRPLGPSDVAALVDWLQVGLMPMEAARRAITASTGKPYGTVKKNHLRHGEIFERD